MPNDLDSDARLDSRFWTIVSCALGSDLIAKVAATHWLRDGRIVSVLDGTLQLRLLYNPGFAFDLPIPAGRFGHALVGVLVVAGLLWIATQVPPKHAGVARYMALFAVMSAGGLGNVVEILFRGNVSDFIGITIGGGRFLTVNLADLMFVGGGLLWLYLRISDGVREQGWREMLRASRRGSYLLIFLPPSLAIRRNDRSSSTPD